MAVVAWVGRAGLAALALGQEMLFNSGIFFFGFVFTLLLYWRLPHKAQNILLLLASTIFYSYWDWRFTLLLVISTGTDFVAGLWMKSLFDKSQSGQARGVLCLSLAVNFGILGFFKYFNFFTDSAAQILSAFGLDVSLPTLNIILPLGISFYTFQSVSYTIDVYRREIEPTRNVLDFFLYIKFFPQLVAGPIERAAKMLPQFANSRKFCWEAFRVGSWLFFWGIFKKVFIADNLAPFTLWGGYHMGAATTGDFWLNAIAFWFRLYCDFSGYSDAALGLGAMLGFKLTRNFDLPAFASNPIELWRRWHITLSHWLRDYVYRPLVSRWSGPWGAASATLLTFSLIGFWHGPHIKFILWGFCWAVLIILYRGLRPTILRLSQYWQLGIVFTLGGILLVNLLWLLTGSLFMARDVSHAWAYVSKLFGSFEFSARSGKDALTLFYFVWPLALIQSAQFLKTDHYILQKAPFLIRVLVYFVLLCLLLAHGAVGGKEFIYFQF